MNGAENQGASGGMCYKEEPIQNDLITPSSTFCTSCHFHRGTDRSDRFWESHAHMCPRDGGGDGGDHDRKDHHDDGDDDGDDARDRDHSFHHARVRLSLAAQLVCFVSYPSPNIFWPHTNPNAQNGQELFISKANIIDQIILVANY